MGIPVREPATTGMHGNAREYLSGNWPPRECTGTLDGTPINSDAQCVLSRCSACHTKNKKRPSKRVVQLLSWLRDFSRNLAAVNSQKSKPTK